MRNRLFAAAIVALTATACSSVSQTSAVPSATSAQQAIVRASKHGIVAPTYIYFEEEGDTANFEVYGRKKNDQQLWKVTNNCNPSQISVAFTKYNSGGSLYTAQGNAVDASCTVIVTNPRGKVGTVQLQVTSD